MKHFIIALALLFVGAVNAHSQTQMTTAQLSLMINQNLSEAQAGNAQAQEVIGKCYFDLKDYNQAIYWLNEAALQGNDEAINELGLCYQYGLGVDINRPKAAELFQKAASMGNDQAKVNLKNLSRPWI